MNRRGPSKLIRASVDDRHDLENYAHTKAVDEAHEDELTYQLAEAVYALDLAERAEADLGNDLGVLSLHDDVRETFHERLDAVVANAVDAEIHGHRVDLRHAMRVDCPECEERVDVYHLGSNGDLDGWVCGHCGATLRTDREGDVVGSDAPEEVDR